MMLSVYMVTYSRSLLMNSDLVLLMNPYPAPNSVIALDNCYTHKSAALREVVEQSGSVHC